jgi:hypothetical protein
VARHDPCQTAAAKLFFVPYYRVEHKVEVGGINITIGNYARRGKRREGCGYACFSGTAFTAYNR